MQLHVNFRKFKRNQNPVAMHTFIVGMTILQKNKVVPSKLKEKIAGQTMFINIWTKVWTDVRAY